MYHATAALRVSTPVLIQILEEHSFRITSDELGVFIYDSLYKEQQYCPYNLIRQYLVRTGNKVYTLCLELIENPVELPFDKNYAKQLMDTEISSNKEMLERFLYYKAIVYCASRLSRVKRLVSEHTIKRDNVDE